jgi:formate hydrogenlyase subunit 3/multisubunit Na+/H+ antiporter MnhD subunit
MRTPYIWIIFPLVASIVLFLLRRWSRLVTWLGIGIALLLAGLAWQLPVGKTQSLGAWPIALPIRIAEDLTILGRQFILTNSQRPVLMIIYIFIAIWMGGAYVAKVGRLFVPFGLALAGILSAALAVKPFLYAALLIGISAMITVPILSPPGKSVKRGVLRFLSFQVLGMPLILIAGWLLTENPTTVQISTINTAGILAGLGLAIMASVFPFHTWIPLVAEETQPYSAGFVLFTFPTIISLFVVNFLQGNILILEYSSIWSILSFMGILMILLGGSACAFQYHLGRMFGFVAISEIGFFLLSLSLYPEDLLTRGESAIAITLAQIIPRGIAMAIWALSLSTLNDQLKNLNFKQVQGSARKFPLITTSIVLAQFSLAGLPLLAGFPVRLTLWSTLARESSILALLALLGSTGVLVGGIRTLAVLVSGKEINPWKISENRAEAVLLIIGWIILFTIGIFPQILTPIGQAASIFMP